MYIIYRL